MGTPRRRRSRCYIAGVPYTSEDLGDNGYRRPLDGGQALTVAREILPYNRNTPA